MNRQAIEIDERTTAGVSCPRCGGSILMPNLSEVVKARVAQSARSKKMTEVIHQLKSYAGISLADAKFIALHTTRMKGICHRCHYPLSNSGQTKCPHCQALNFDW